MEEDLKEDNISLKDAEEQNGVKNGWNQSVNYDLKKSWAGLESKQTLYVI